MVLKLRSGFPRQLSVIKENRRSEEHTSELQSRLHLVCRLLLEKKKTVRCRAHPGKSPLFHEEPRLPPVWIRAGASSRRIIDVSRQCRSTRRRSAPPADTCFDAT